jgi:hypothetical protein
VVFGKRLPTATAVAVQVHAVLSQPLQCTRTDAFVRLGTAAAYNRYKCVAASGTGTAESKRPAMPQWAAGGLQLQLQAPAPPGQNTGLLSMTPDPPPPLPSRFGGSFFFWGGSSWRLADGPRPPPATSTCPACLTQRPSHKPRPQPDAALLALSGCWLWFPFPLLAVCCSLRLVIQNNTQHTVSGTAPYQNTERQCVRHSHIGR